MAYVVSSIISKSSAGSATFTPTQPAHVADSLLLNFALFDWVNLITVPTAGWSSILTPSSTGATSGIIDAFAYKIATGASEAVTFGLASGSDDWAGIACRIDDADTTTPLNIPSATFTVTIASPGVFTYSGADCWQEAQSIQLSTTGALPTGLNATTQYFIKSLDTGANTFQLSATSGGGAINTSGSQSGTHTMTAMPLSTATTGSTLASPPFSTTEDGCLLIYCCSSDGDDFIRTDQNDLSFVDYSQNYNTNSCIMGWANQATAGPVPSITWTRSGSADGFRSWVVAVKNKSGGGIRGEVLRRCDVQRLHGAFQLGTYTAPNANPPNITDIDGITTFHSSSGLSEPSNADGGHTIQLTNSSALTNTWVGGWDTFASQDLSGDILSMRWQTPNVIDGLVAPRGLIMVLVDSALNWKAYTIAKNADGQMLTGETKTSFIDVDGGTTLDASGGFDSTIVTRKGLFYLRNAGSTTAATFTLGPVFKQDGMVVGSGNSVTPLTPFDIAFGSAEGPSLTQVGWGLKKTVALQGTQQIVLPFSCQFGDGGTTVTNLNLSGASIETPADGDYLWNVAYSKITMTLYAGASDTFNLSSGILRANTRQTLTIHASSSTAASYNFVGRAFFGWDINWLSGIPCTGASFTGCYDVDMKGADLTDCTFSKPASTACVKITANGSVFENCSLDVTRTGTDANYHMELGASVTAITLNGTTLSGTPVTDKIYSALASGTLTITTDGLGTSLVAGDVTFVGGSTAVAVIAAPAVYQKVIVSGQTAGSRIQIYDTTNSIELFNGTASAGDTVVSGTVATWTDPTAAAGSRAIRVRVAYVSGATAKMWQQNTGLTCGTSSTTNSITYPITMSDDDTYNDNAIDGPAIYATSGITFTDAATDLVNISIAGGAVTWQTIYACFVYWLFTAAGIDDDVAYIDAPDPANYLLTSMKLKNTHANPLTVTGGYGRSATTGLVADIIDTAGSTGNIFPSPDHVVAYATGSGSLTAGDITNIWAASTRTITTTIPAAADNAAAVAAVAVDGSTTLAESLRLANAVLGGKVSGAGTGTETFRDLANTKDRVVATVDSSGNRTAITRDLT